MANTLFWKRKGIGQKVVLFAVSLMMLAPQLHSKDALAAACATPGTDYGTVSGLSTTIANTGTYKIWSRMSAPSSSTNTYLLEIDGSTCYTVGGSTVPVYAGGATTFFANNSTNWINITDTGATISMSLTAGAHTIKLIGTGAGVVVDRLIFTQSTTCIPTGTGNNCADAVAPTLSSITASSVTQNAALITWTSNEVASTLVEYGTTTSYGSTAGNNPSLISSHSVPLSSLSTGTTYHYRVTSTDEAGNTTVSTDKTLTTASTIVYASSDVNQDGITGILDVSLLISKWNVSGSSAVLGRNDINGDGVVNILDLSLLITNYGH